MTNKHGKSSEKVTTMTFVNGSNNYRKTVTTPGLWTFLFGPFYFGLHGVWGHALLSFVLALMTLGFSWLVYPFFAHGILRNAYLSRGWREEGSDSAPVPTDAAAATAAGYRARAAAEPDTKQARIVMTIGGCFCVLFGVMALAGHSRFFGLVLTIIGLAMLIHGFRTTTTPTDA